MFLTQTTHQLYQYALLMRLHRPIGTLLLLWPTLIALWFASRGTPSPKLILIFSLGVLVMRSAGCVVNDYADRNIDGFVARTKTRPLVSGKVSAKEAIFLFLCLLLIALGLVLCTNVLTIYLSSIGALLAFAYPFTKRFTHFPQVVLGAAFGWAIPMAYSAQAVFLPLDCWLLFTSTLLWALAYDTIYAMVDKADDLNIGVKSSAIAFGQFDKLAVGLCHMGTLGLFVIIGCQLHLGSWYFFGAALAFCNALYQQWLIRYREPDQCFKAFLTNQWFGAALFFGTVIDYAIINKLA